MGRPACGRKSTELMESRTYVQLKGLVLDGEAYIALEWSVRERGVELRIERKPVVNLLERAEDQRERP